MAIPDFQSMMLPILEFAQDGQTHTNRDAVEYIAERYQLTLEERKELLPSGRQTRLANRVAWALVHMRHAELIASPGRGQFIITDHGREALRGRPDRIDLHFLARYDEYRAWRGKEAVENTDAKIVTPIEETPEEALGRAYTEWRELMQGELQSRLASCAPGFFEQLVLDLLVRMGYGGSRIDAAQVVGGSGDGGIDGIINEDRLGLDVVYVQAKRWQGSVGAKELRAFAGSLAAQHANKGVFITTSSYTKDALDFVGRVSSRIVLIDGRRLAELMLDFGVGVQEKTAYRIYRIDDDYFSGNE
jgi:restriction system protein